MKRLQVLLIILFSTLIVLGQDTLNTTLKVSKSERKKQDIFVRNNIIGEWKDENSTLLFYSNGECKILPDKDYEILDGVWEIRNNILRFGLGSTRFLLEFKLLYFSPIEMKIQKTKFYNDKTILTAKKIGDLGGY
ncbi:MAG: hypothetical protein ABIP69_01810 [Ferruginibacter sp.]